MKTWVGKTALPDIIIYYKVIINMAVWYLCGDRPLEEIERLATNPHTYYFVIYLKEFYAEYW